MDMERIRVRGLLIGILLLGLGSLIYSEVGFMCGASCPEDCKVTCEEGEAHAYDPCCGYCQEPGHQKKYCCESCVSPPG